MISNPRPPHSPHKPFPMPVGRTDFGIFQRTIRRAAPSAFFSGSIRASATDNAHTAIPFLHLPLLIFVEINLSRVLFSVSLENQCCSFADLLDTQVLSSTWWPLPLLSIRQRLTFALQSKSTRGRRHLFWSILAVSTRPLHFPNSKISAFFFADNFLQCVCNLMRITKWDRGAQTTQHEGETCTLVGT